MLWLFVLQLFCMFDSRKVTLGAPRADRWRRARSLAANNEAVITVVSGTNLVAEVRQLHLTSITHTVESLSSTRLLPMFWAGKLCMAQQHACSEVINRVF